MDNIKLTVNIELPGSSMFRKEACQKSSKKFMDYNSIIVEDSVKQGKKVKVSREKIQFFTRKSIPALQVINMTEEAYKYMTSNEVPEFSNKNSWSKLSNTLRLEAHLKELATSMGGILRDYCIYPD